MTKRQTKTPEERKAAAEALRADFAAQVEALRDSDEWARMLAAAARLHRYSLGNLLLIFRQCERATAVAGFQAWKKEGRVVRKGERGIKIFAPMTVKTGEVTDDGEDEKRTIFRPVSVFDISQTKPLEGEDDGGTPTPVYRLLDGEDDGKVFEAVRGYLTGKGWTVETGETPTGVEGWAHGPSKTVRVSDEISPRQAAVVVLHEAAHVTLGHCDDGHGYSQHRGRDEVAAESTAYVVAKALGIDAATASVPYVAGWVDGPEGADAIEQTAADVLSAAHAMIEAVEAQADEAAAAA